MRRLLVLAMIALPLAAHDFWIEPSSFRPARGEALTASLRVGEKFHGDPIERDGIEFVERGPLTVIGYRSASFGKVSLPREKFDTYLEEEGLRIQARTNGLQRERYLRFAKAVAGSGPIEEATSLGWRFELVPLSESRFQLLYEGQPLRDSLVVAISRSGNRVEQRTNAEGTVSLELPRGTWLVKSVHMIPAPARSGFDWESLWASLTFEK
jgi:uncharacterized GH25 family protein